jgi:hypothetical protein
MSSIIWTERTHKNVGLEIDENDVQVVCGLGSRKRKLERDFILRLDGVTTNIHDKVARHASRLSCFVVLCSMAILRFDLTTIFDTIPGHLSGLRLYLKADKHCNHEAKGPAC